MEINHFYDRFSSFIHIWDYISKAYHHLHYRLFLIIPYCLTNVGEAHFHHLTESISPTIIHNLILQLFCLVFISHGIFPIPPHRNVGVITIVTEVLTHLPACILLDVFVGNRPVQVVLAYFVVEYTSVGID